MKTKRSTKRSRRVAKRRAAKKKVAAKPRVARTADTITPTVPLPRGYTAPRTYEQLRRASGYTSARISKATLELLREVEQKSIKASTHKNSWGWETTAPAPGLDSLLYFDALQRLGKLPSKKALGGDE